MSGSVDLNFAHGEREFDDVVGWQRVLVQY